MYNDSFVFFLVLMRVLNTSNVMRQDKHIINNKLLMAFEICFRYFHIVKTSKYRTIYTPKNAKLIVVSGWIAALITPLTYTAAGKDYVFQPGKFFCFMESKFTLLVVPFYGFIGISMVILVVCYLNVFKALKAHERAVANNLRTGNTRKTAISLEDIKVTKILFATVVGFILCWTPVLVIDIVDAFLGSEWALTRGTYYMYTIFGISSSAINPIIYGVMNPSYRKAYLRLFGFSRLGRVGDITTMSKAPERISKAPERTRTDLHMERSKTAVTNVHEQNSS
ncbi:melatonin receptor type 1A-like [Oculina patagonica]